MTAIDLIEFENLSGLASIGFKSRMADNPNKFQASYLCPEGLFVFTFGAFLL
jgi:hypothetical protein